MMREGQAQTGARRMAQTFGIAVLIALAVSGCSVQQMAVDTTAGALKEGKVGLERESDLVFARAAFPASLKTMETLLVVSPENADLQEMLAEGFFSYAFVALESAFERAQYDGSEEERLDSLNRRAVLHFLRARDYGFMLLDRPVLEDAARKLDSETVKIRLKDLDETHVAALFWIANGWAQAANLGQDDPDLVGALPVLEVIMERVIQLNDDFYYAGAHLFFGTYFASRPPMFGGDPDRSKKHYDIAMERHGEYNLLIPYMMGRYYAVQVQDRTLFNKMMKHVLDADVARYPGLRLSNEAARERARFWVENVDELFFE